MRPEHWAIVAVVIYFFVFVGVVVVLAKGRLSRRRTRPPVDFKFLRGPGESLRQRMAKVDESAEFLIPAVAFAPVLVLGAALWALGKYHPQTNAQVLLGLGIAALAFAAAFVLAVSVVWRRLVRYRNDYLGYRGERYVGDCLEPLKRQGWFVFHDVPGEGAAGKFNIDHVAVGPGGVWAIETKTRRKGNARPGFEPTKVLFDGKQLIWPWGEDAHGPKQAKDNAEWLAEWLFKRTGVRIDVRPVLALPGWYVVDKAGAAVRVVRPEWLCTDLPKARPILTEQQVDLIVRQLDLACRDVED